MNCVAAFDQCTHQQLSHWGGDKMAAMSQKTYSSAFSWMKMLKFRFEFHRSLFLRVQLTIFQHWFGWWLGADQATIHYLNQLDMSTARRRLKSPWSLSGTSAHPTMVTQVNIMIMNGWLTSFSFIVNRPSHSWDKAISTSDRETPRSRSWVWSKGRVIQSAQYHINSLPLHFTSIRPNNSGDRAISKFDFETSKVKVMSEVKVTYCTQYPTNALPFYFHINRTNHSWDMAKIVFDLEKTHPKFIRKFAKITVFNINSLKCNQVIPMTRTIKLPRFILIRWVVLTSSCRQTNFC